MKLAASVETFVQATTLGPLVVQPVAASGSVTVYARAEAAKARRAKAERMFGTGCVLEGGR